MMAKKEEKDINLEPQEQPIFQVMSENDRYIADIVKSQPKTLDEITMVKEPKYSPGEHRLSLPKELKPYEDKFGFRWINKKKRAIDEARIKGWVIVNRALFPDVAKKAKRLFSISGAVERGDSILACISRPIAEAIRRAPGEKSSAYLKSQLDKGKESLSEGQSGFYKPKENEF